MEEILYYRIKKLKFYFRSSNIIFLMCSFLIKTWYTTDTYRVQIKLIYKPITVHADPPGIIPLLRSNLIFYSTLKGVLAKNERGYRLNAKNKRF